MAPKKPKVYSVQPRYKRGGVPRGWYVIDAITRLGEDLPAYGSVHRDSYLSTQWMNEPLLAGVFSTWVERVQTVNWKITGGRNTANYYANLLNEADGGLGWSYHEGMCAIDYLSTDKGGFEELGRSKARSTTGRVMGIQHIDSVRLVMIGEVGQRWRYFPEVGRGGEPFNIPDANIIQLVSLPSGREHYAGNGVCALSRLVESKTLMLGYLVYFRQEIGNLPPELVAIINGLPQTVVEDSLKKYRMELKKKNLDTYGRVWWLGSDDEAVPVTLDIKSLTVPNKSFDYRVMTEWWAKLLALNTGEDVGEYWLIQHSGSTKAVQSVQAMKSRGKGTAKYLQEKERLYNFRVLPYGVVFQYDNKDDDQDRAVAEILSQKVSTLYQLASVGVEQQDFAYTIEEIRRLAVEWEIVPSEFGAEEVPRLVGSAYKHLVDEDTYVVDRSMKMYKVNPVLRGREGREAEHIYHAFQDLVSGKNRESAMQHKADGLEGGNGVQKVTESQVVS